jgi:hypothetical protein
VVWQTAPKGQKIKKKKKKNVVGFAFGGSQTTPKGHGGGFNHLDRPMGVVKLPPWPLAVVEPPSMAKRGWLFFIYLLFLISNNILLLFLISGIRVPFVVVEFLIRNFSHELNILQSIFGLERIWIPQ